MIVIMVINSAKLLSIVFSMGKSNIDKFTFFITHKYQKLDLERGQTIDIEQH